MRQRQRLWATLFCILLTGGPMHADSPAMSLVNGQTWTATLPNGQTVGMIFEADGRVRVRALFAPSMSWTATDDGLCLQGGPGGQRCATLTANGTGFVGTDNGEIILLLAR